MEDTNRNFANTPAINAETEPETPDYGVTENITCSHDEATNEPVASAVILTDAGYGGTEDFTEHKASEHFTEHKTSNDTASASNNEADNVDYAPHSDTTSSYPQDHPAYPCGMPQTGHSYPRIAPDDAPMSWFYQPKFIKGHRNFIECDDSRAMEDCLEYAFDHAFSVRFTDTSTSELGNIALKASNLDFKLYVTGDKQIAPDGTKLNDKPVFYFIHICRLNDADEIGAMINA